MNKKQNQIVTLELTEEEVETLKEEFPIAPSSWVKGNISTELGTRRNQQDCAMLSIDKEHRQAFAIVCDGMGGLQGGELASQLAVAVFIEDYEEKRKELDNYYYFFQEEAQKVDQMVSELENNEGEPLDSGTTLVAVSLQDDLLQWISVGDSKIYIIRGNEIVSVASEHTYLNYLNLQLLRGEITMEEYELEQPRGAALTSYIGMGNVEMMEINYEPLQLMDGDVILLCSDGLYKGMSEEDILHVIQNTEGEIPEILDKLQEIVKENCSKVQDNTTMIMLKYND